MVSIFDKMKQLLWFFEAKNSFDSSEFSHAQKHKLQQKFHFLL